MNYGDYIELDNVTIGDCIDLFSKKNIRIVVEDGHITNFIREGE